MSTVLGTCSTPYFSHSFSSQSPPRRHDGVRREDVHALAAVRLGHGHPLAHPVFDDEGVALVVEQDLHAVFQEVFFDGEIDALRLFRAHVADGAVHEFEPRLNGAQADLLDFVARIQPFDVFVRAEFEIDLIGIVDGLLRERFADELGQISPHFAA